MKKARKNPSAVSYAGFAIVFVLLVLCIIFLSSAIREKVISPEEIPAYLLRALSVLGFTLSTALAAEALSLPFCIALSLGVNMIAPDRIRRLLERTASGLSAIPAVVLGFMSLEFYVPGIASPWWAVVVTLLLMSLMEQTMDFIRINAKQSALVERARALGANARETVLVFLLPQVKRGYLLTAVNTLVRDLSEGVAILLVLSYYDSEADTLSTAIMKAVGVTGETRSLIWLLLLVVVLLLLSATARVLPDVIRKGGIGHEA